MSRRQLFFLILLTTPIFKIATLPSYMSNLAGQDMWISVILPLLFDVLVLFLILCIKKRVGVLCFQNRFFKTVAVAICVAVIPYFLLQFAVYGEEMLNYLLQAFFDEGDRIQIAIPFIVCAVYLGYKGAKTLGRVCEVFVWFFCFAVLLGVIFNNAEIDFSNLKPILDGNAGDKIFGGYKAYFWFGDYLPLLFIDYRDRKKSRPLLVLGGGVSVSVLITALFAVFVAQWGDFASSVPNAFARLSGYNVISADVGKIDWITILTWITCGVIKLSVLILGLSGAVKCLFGEKIGKYAPVGGGIVVLTLLAFWIKDIKIAYQVGQNLSVVGVIFTLVSTVLLLVFALLTPKTDQNLEKTGDGYE